MVSFTCTLSVTCIADSLGLLWMASHSCDHLPPPLFPLWTACATQKDEFLTLCHHHRLLEATLNSASVGVFSRRTRNFRLIPWQKNVQKRM